MRRLTVALRGSIGEEQYGWNGDENLIAKNSTVETTRTQNVLERLMLKEEARCVSSKSKPICQESTRPGKRKKATCSTAGVWLCITFFRNQNTHAPPLIPNV